MLNVNNISEWKDALGLLPIKLFTNPNDDQNFILLNGGIGDFCLQINGETQDTEYYYSSAWSCNTKNFVAVEADSVKLFNWKKEKIENIKRSSVEQNYEEFYKYLIENSISSDSDIIPFVLNIYRKLRNLVNDKSNGATSLNLLFALLAAYEDNVSAQNVDPVKWDISEINNINLIDDYIAEFSNGLKGRKPNVGLLLRHSSGVIFQEAQREALLFDKNLDLFTGTLSSIYSTRKLFYSSIHYTPQYLARTIVENTLNGINLANKGELRILDPSCGSSEFLMEALKQLKSKNYNGNVLITGWDTSESAINTSKFLLAYEKREWGDSLTVDISLVEDSLLQVWGEYDIVLMNPPFVSWEQMPKNAKESVRESLSDVFDGKPNQASAFFYKSILSLKPDGVIGCVMPSSILTLDSYKKLRTNVLENIALSLIGKLGNFIFEDALTDVSIILAKKSAMTDVPLVLWTRNDKGIAHDALRDLRKMLYGNMPLLNNKEYSIYKPIRFPINSEDWKLISYAENNFLNKIERNILTGSLTRISEVFDVQQGIRSGSNTVFKLKTNEYELIPQNERKFFRPVIDNDSIKNNVLYRKNYIWYPYDSQGLVLKTENELIELAPYFYQTRLKINEKELKDRKGISEWWGLTRPRKAQYKTSKGICTTEFGKSDSFAFDSKGEFVIERGNSWVPKKEFKDDDYYYFYLAIFSSPFFDSLLSIYSKQLAGGYWYDLGKKYTKNIPIPKFNRELAQQTSFRQLVQMGKDISEDNFNDYGLRESIITESIYPAYGGTI